MHALHIQRMIAEAVDSPHHVQKHKRDHALAVGRALPDFAVTEFGADRIDIVADGGGEVRLGVPAADAAKLGDDLLGDGAFIESASPFFADPLKRGRQRRLGVAGTKRNRPAIAGKDAARVAVEAVHLACEITGHTLCDRISVPGVADGRQQQPVEGHAPMIAVQLNPRVDGARHRYGMRGMAFDPGYALGKQGLRAEPIRRPPGAVEGDDALCAARGRIEAEAVTADAGRFGLDDALHGAGGDGGVKRVAAVQKNADRRLCRQGMRSAGHAVRRGNRRAAGILEMTHDESLPFCPTKPYRVAVTYANGAAKAAPR